MKTNETAADIGASKNEVCALLRKFINSRPGVDFNNYGDRASYFAEVRGITRQRKEALELLRAVELRDSITLDAMLAGFSAFSGRLAIGRNSKGKLALEYCAGQYYCTEYRAAAAAVLASVLWSWAREKAMSAPTAENVHDGLSGGAWLRRFFRREFGRGIQSRWFN